MVDTKIIEKGEIYFLPEEDGCRCPGFPDEKPDYPKKLKGLFAEERWIDITDPKLLGYENAKFLLIGARDDLRAYDVKIPEHANLFKTLGLDESDWPTEALEKGSFAMSGHGLEAEKPEKSRIKGGEIEEGKAILSAYQEGRP